MFLGEYSHSLDDKGRLTIPARFRRSFESGLFITRGYDPCLSIYTRDEWSNLAAKIEQTPRSSRLARSYSRLIFGGAFETTLDRVGRILIPTFLREYAGITDQAVIVGVNTLIEVWAPERWQRMVDQDSGAMEEILAELSRMGI